MGDGIMGMNDIKAGLPGDGRNFVDQGQGVGRVFEKRIGGEFHLMVLDPGVKAREPEGLLVRYEMNLVPPGCQVLAQFRGHHTAAPVRRIA